MPDERQRREKGARPETDSLRAKRLRSESFKASFLKKNKQSADACRTAGIGQGQAKKSKGRMPRHQEPKKDAESCEKPRGGATATDPRVSEWGNPIGANPYHPMANK